MPAPAATSTCSVPVAIVRGWAPGALTARGAAAAHLSRLEDEWDQLDARDRQWFAEWLRDLFMDAVDACEEAPA